MLLFSHIFFTKEFYIFAQAMRDFIDIHTHSPREGVRSVVNRRLGAEPAECAVGLFSAGIHPWDAERLYPTLEGLLIRLENADCVAIGEIGLDKACGVSLEIQREVFDRQLAIARRRNLPLIIHNVRATAELLALLGREEPCAAIFHGFIGSSEQAREILSRGNNYLSFGFGSLASPKSLKALREVSLERMFLETDTSTRPIEELYDFIAKEKGTDIELLKEKINNNFKTIFR